MERIERGQPFTVIVDYAHSPASLETVLDLLAPVAAAGGGGLIAVFGSAGERDRAKRPMMGRIAGERCRLVVVTDEDPRGEDRMAILDAIARGAEAAGRRRDRDLLLIADRRTAIEAAIERARARRRRPPRRQGPRALDHRTRRPAAVGRAPSGRSGASPSWALTAARPQIDRPQADSCRSRCYPCVAMTIEPIPSTKTRRRPAVDVPPAKVRPTVKTAKAAAVATTARVKTQVARLPPQPPLPPAAAATR